MKICSKCKENKSLDDFSKDKYSKDKLRYSCKKCNNIVSLNRKKKKSIFTCIACGQTKEVDFYADRRRKTNYCLNCCSTKTQTGIRRSDKDQSYISTDGYKMVKIVGEYDSRNKPLYKREHILVMENYLGRKLKTQRGRMGEQVHHIDGNKLNNDIDNLLFCSDTRDHKNIDCQLHSVAFQLVQNGVILFDKEKREYTINESRIT